MLFMSAWCLGAGTQVTVSILSGSPSWYRPHALLAPALCTTVLYISAAHCFLPITVCLQSLPWPQYEGASELDRGRHFASKMQQLVQEEMRAQLQKAVKESGRLQWVSVDVGLHEQGDSASELPELTVLKVAANRRHQPGTNVSMTGQRRPMRGPAGVKKTDIVVVSSKPVHKTSSWRDPELLCSLGLVEDLYVQDDGSTAALVKIYTPPGSAMRADLEQSAGPDRHSQPSWSIALLDNCVTLQRIQAALKGVHMGNVSRVLRTVLHPDVAALASQSQHSSSTATPTDTSQPHGPSFPSSRASDQHQDMVAHIQRYCQQRQLNESQAQAVQQVSWAAYSSSEPAEDGYAHVQLIQGPPGTGKTSTIGRYCVRTIHTASTESIAMPMPTWCMLTPRRCKAIAFCW